MLASVVSWRWMALSLMAIAILDIITFADREPSVESAAAPSIVAPVDHSSSESRVVREHLGVRVTVGEWQVFTNVVDGELGLYRARAGTTECVARLDAMPDQVEVSGGKLYTYRFRWVGSDDLEERSAQTITDIYEIDPTIAAHPWPFLRMRPFDGTDEVARLHQLDGRVSIVVKWCGRTETLVEPGSSLVMVATAYREHWIFFVRDRVMWRISSRGGSAQRLATFSVQPDRMFLSLDELSLHAGKYRWTTKVDQAPAPDTRARCSDS